MVSLMQTSNEDTAAVEKNLAAATQAVANVGEIPQRALTDVELGKLADVVMSFAQEMAGVDLFPYEYEFGWRIVYSLLVEDADEITALFSRQSGKTETVAVTVVGVMVILPALAEVFIHDERIRKFKDGVWCGIYAPGYEQASIMWSRMKLRMYSKSAKAALLDPDIDIDLDAGTENLVLPNGSFCDCGTAAPQASIEGKTYHLILLEETQDISSAKIRASIHPMAAATAGTLVKIGTCNRTKSDFYQACRRNKRQDMNAGRLRSRKRNHYEFDYTVAQRYNPRYRKYVEKEKVRLGEDSDDFKMKYRLHWMLERGMFVSSDLLDECGIIEKGLSLFVTKGRGRRKRKIEFTRPPNVVTYDQHTEGLVFSVDVGRENSTVVTIGKPFWDCPILHGKEERFPLHIYNWLELHGDDHEQQHPQILEFLQNYRLSMGIVDATGKGDPIFSRLEAELDKFGIYVMPFIFSSQSKDVGYKVLGQEISTRRLTFPAGARATRLQKWQRFYGQMTDLEKNWRGQTLVVNKSKDDKDARDDFPDSLMMLSYLVQVRQSMEIESAANPMVGRLARWAGAEMMQQAGAWYRSVREPPRASIPRTPRASKRGKW